MDMTRSPAWQRCANEAARLAPLHLRQLFAADAGRTASLSFAAAGLHVDCSKQRLDAAALAALVALADAAGVAAARDAMFAGERVNVSEQRAALHVALRRSSGPFPGDKNDVMPAVLAARRRMADFAGKLRRGDWLGASGQAIRAIVNIGIGGSDLGPKMATQALQAIAHDELAVHYVSNLDGTQLASLLADLDPATTLFIIASKTFTTQETMINAGSARAWLTGALGDTAVHRHFAAVSAAGDRAAAFGIAEDMIFPMWDWVGGRYSLWSAVGLPLMIAIGSQAFDELLAGAAVLDEHFLQAPLAANLPVLLALVGVWNSNFLAAPTLAVLPYNESLRHLPAYLQQLEMESNGKSVGRHGEALSYTTTPVLWGELGNNGQHAFFQLLHQGGRLVPCDFIVSARPDHALPGHHDALLANCLAQSAALAFGKTAAAARAELVAAGRSGDGLEALVAQKTFAGNQPSTTIVLPRLTPRALGALLALYEHKVLVQSAIWGINPFDQWGVELGKALAATILPAVHAAAAGAELDASTRSLLDWCRRQP